MSNHDFDFAVKAESADPFSDIVATRQNDIIRKLNQKSETISQISRMCEKHYNLSVALSDFNAEFGPLLKGTELYPTIIEFRKYIDLMFDEAMSKVSK